MGSGVSLVIDAADRGHPQLEQPPATVTPPILSTAGGHDSCGTAAAATAVAAAGPSPCPPLAGVTLPSPLVRTVLTGSLSPSLATGRGCCGGTGDGGGGGSCSSAGVAAWRGEASVEQPLATAALRGRHGRPCPAGGGVEGGGWGGGSDGRLRGTNGDRSRRRAGAGPREVLEVSEGGAVGGSAAGGGDAEMRVGEQEQEEEEDEDEDEDENSGVGADCDVIDLTAMDVELTQQQEEAATVSLIYGDVGD